MSRKIYILVASLLLMLLASACSGRPTQTEPAQVIEPTFTPPPARLPVTEAEVRRVTVEEAQVALESGEAVMVDVRSPAAFEASHIAGALSIPLADVETNPTSLNLDKDQWIITYCT